MALNRRSMAKEQVAKTCALLVILTVVAVAWCTDWEAHSTLAAGPRAALDTLTVNNTYDETGSCTPSFCTLRQAILDANEQPGADTIQFEIPTSDPGYDPGSKTWTLVLDSPLPVLDGEDEMIIDATSLGGGTCAAHFFIDAGSVPYGLEISGASKTIRGLGIRYAQVNGLHIYGQDARDNSVACSQSVDNGQDGVHIRSDASGNTIGPSNLFAGNGGDGVEITNLAHDNTVAGNRIGTNAEGTAPWPNGGYGVNLSHGALNNTIGLTTEDGSNLISSNALAGVAVIAQASQGNVVQSNRIGIDMDGAAALGNQEGVLIDSAENNTIGPLNIISGNSRDGVRITGGQATANVVKGNQIGMAPGTPDRVSNQRFGVLVEGEAHHNTIGGPVRADGNEIVGNGYDGDYPVYGGVGFFGGSHHNSLWSNWIGVSSSGFPRHNGWHGVWLDEGAHDNAIGEGDRLLKANVITKNEGDGIYVHGVSTVHNTIGRNEIYDNSGAGINNEAGGNEELAPPEILSYLSGPWGDVVLEAKTCAGCTVLVFSDDAGEGLHYEGRTAGNATSGHFSWIGAPISAAFSLLATDGAGNSSEFSELPVRLLLSIDDALPGVAVSKVRGDSDAPAGNTVVEIVATIVSDHPLLTDDFQVEIQVPNDVFGPPERVLYRDDLSDYEGTAVAWSSPAAGHYRVQGVNLMDVLGQNLLRKHRRVVFRFAIPHGAPLGPLQIAGRASHSTGMFEDDDSALVRLVTRVDEIIITNRAVLYRDYNDEDVSSFLHALYALAQGPPFNWSPPSAIYYVDAYAPSLSSWNNQSVDYSSEAAANVAADLIDDMIEDWAEDSTTQWQTMCFGPGTCLTYPVDTPPFLLVAGDDNIVPFYRLDDPTDSEGEETCPDVCAQNQVLDLLRENDYFFTENAYANLAYVPDAFDWDAGGVELLAGRLIGPPQDMSQMMVAGQYGPNPDKPARAIVASSCEGKEGDSAKHLREFGYDVRNDDEIPSTIRNDDWTIAVLETLMQEDYQVLVHASHASEKGWCTPPCDCDGALDVTALSSSSLAGPIASNGAVFSSSGCRAGLSPATPISVTVASVLVQDGAPAVMASTGLTFGCTWPESWICSGEDLLQTFWGEATCGPSSCRLSLGGALYWAKRTWDGHITIDDEESKTGAEFTLYGLPWVTLPYRGTSTERGFPGSQPSDPATLLPAAGPRAVGQDTYLFSASFEAWDHSVIQLDGFDLVEVGGMALSHDYPAPAIPLAEASLNLPRDAVVTDIAATFSQPLSLGTLNIPSVRLGIPIPGGDPGGPEPVPDMGIYPGQPVFSHTVPMDDYQTVRFYASPLSYDTATGEATLYRKLTIEATYHLSSEVTLLGMDVSPANLSPGQPFAVNAPLFNASDGDVTLRGSLILKNSLGQVVDAIESFDIVVPPGQNYPLEYPWIAPDAEGSYSLFLELRHGEALEAVAQASLSVTHGRILDLEVPRSLRKGDLARFVVHFANSQGQPFVGRAVLSIYRASGMPLTRLEAPVELEPWSETQVELFWDTEGFPAGSYIAAATVADLSQSVTYGVKQREVDLLRVMYLPLIQRGSVP